MQRDVVIVGYRLNAREPAPKALERILGLTPEAARKLARSFPAVVLARASTGAAEQLADTLRDAGALVELRDTEDTTTAAGLPPTRAQPEAASRAGAHAGTSTAVAAQPALPPLRDELPVAREQEDADPTTIYQLGDFGLGSSAPVANETQAAAPAPAPPLDSDFSLDLDLTGAGGLVLELDAPANANAARSPDASGVSAGFDDRFDDLVETAAPALPQVEERAYRAIQRAPRAESRRPPGSAPPRAGPGPLVRAARAWLPSLAALSLLSIGSLLAVGYAIDPGDVLGILSRPRETAPDTPAESERDGALHPLLAAAPGPARAPLAAVLRARIAGVHMLPQSFRSSDGRLVDCMLVEQRADDTEERLAALRRTGREVAPPAEAGPLLREQAQSLRATRGAQLALTSVCLVP